MPSKARILSCLVATLLLVGLAAASQANAATTLLISADDPGGNGASNGAADSFRLVRTGETLDVYVGGNLSRSLDFGSLESVTVSGSNDDDTLTLDFAGGNPVPVGGLTYHGRANVTETGDTMKLASGSAASVSYRFFNETDGALDIDGRAVAYTGLEPIIDTITAATLTVNGTNGANSITYRSGSSGRGLVAVDAFETIEFANKTSLVINAGDADDTIVLNNSGTPPGLTTVVVNGGNGNDTTSVYVTPVAVTMHGEDGDDLFRVAPSPSATITADGGGQVLGDLLLVDATGGKAKDTGTAVEVEGFTPVDYTDVEGVDRVTTSKRKKLLKSRPAF